MATGNPSQAFFGPKQEMASPFLPNPQSPYLPFGTQTFFSPATSSTGCSNPTFPPQARPEEPLRGKRRTKLTQSTDRQPNSPRFEGFDPVQLQAAQMPQPAIQQLQLAQQIQLQILQQMQLNHLLQGVSFPQYANPQFLQPMNQTGSFAPTMQPNPLQQQVGQPFQMPLPYQTPLPQLQQIQQYQQMLLKLQQTIGQNNEAMSPTPKNEPMPQIPEPPKQIPPNSAITPETPTRSPFTPKFEQYDFMSESRSESVAPPPKVGNKRRLRNTPPKPGDSDRSRQANSRMRDTNGSFTSKQKTDVLDLTYKLHSSEFECNKLKKEVAGKDQEMAELKARLQEFERRTREQQIHLQYLEMVQQRQALEHLGVIRSFKARTQYLSQLEKLFEERRRREEGTGSPPAQSEESTTMPISPDVNSLSINDQQSPIPPIHPNETPGEQGQTLMSEVPNLFQQTPVLTPPPSVLPVGPETVHPFTFQHGAIPNHANHGQQHSVPATWFNYESLWNEAMLPAFREKIDFSAIQLRHYGSPNIVEQAKMEYYEAHRRWQEQLQQVNNLPLSPRPKTLKHKAPTNALHTAKINFKDEISRLKKINSVAKQNEYWELTGDADENAPIPPAMLQDQKLTVPDNSSGSPTSQTPGEGSLFLNSMEEFQISDHMDMCLSPSGHPTEEQDEWFNEFFTEPAPTAVIYKDELETKESADI